jgi:hypothetical protein
VTPQEIVRRVERWWYGDVHDAETLAFAERCVVVALADARGERLPVGPIEFLAAANKKGP